MDMTTEAALRRLLDRQDILDCITRYCRGVDRFDRDLLLSAYHPDAVDDHGTFVGSPEDFWEWVQNIHGAEQLRTMHSIANHTCDIDGDIAHAETYCLYFGSNRDHTVDFCGNRYIDRLERRDGVWKIAVRVCVVDFFAPLADPSIMPEYFRKAMHELMNNAPAGRSREDASYMRPLTVEREERVSPKHEMPVD